ncbi:hypothetical protein Cni_G21021 [Canna indica]|uniref:GIR1-like zinc ribbon domain-containing protein n=1 Tax=Canna indica TaxID=4628 RepID=A0AAQ3QLB0_9LILI|nr:hypothetical protein Cni_G21021 [Canna indica]
MLNPVVGERLLMAADVSSLAQMLRGYEEGEGKRDLVTRDLLGGGGTVPGSAEVDLEYRVPAGWERRLDLVSGRTYLRKREANPAPRHHHDLNLTLPPPSSAALFLGLDAAARPSAYQSVCTLEKVRSALDRAGRADGSHSPPSSWTAASSSTKRRTTAAAADRVVVDGSSPESPAAPAMTVAGCPVCLLYVLVSAAEPRCPRCATHVPIYKAAKKKPKFDLNSSNEEDGEALN